MRFRQCYRLALMDLYISAWISFYNISQKIKSGSLLDSLIWIAAPRADEVSPCRATAKKYHTFLIYTKHIVRYFIGIFELHAPFSGEHLLSLFSLISYWRFPLYLSEGPRG